MKKEAQKREKKQFANNFHTAKQQQLEFNQKQLF